MYVEGFNVETEEGASGTNPLWYVHKKAAYAYRNDVENELKDDTKR